MFHYHPGEIAYDDQSWEAYEQVNRIFAQKIAQDINNGDTVWIHDYHFMLLPRMLREETVAKPDIKIGFFLHTPFPSSEIYRMLPVRTQILEGVLEADLIGFHTFDYARHFISSCSKVLGISSTPNGVEFRGKIVNIGAFPIGIDPSKFEDGLKQEDVQRRITDMKKQFRDQKVIVGVDRLDYIKGLPQKLHAFELLLDQHPEHRGKVTLVQVAVPSRQDVEEYQNLRTVVQELVGSINGKFGTVDYVPIRYMHSSIDFNELLATYAVSDVCFVTSTRDGMNLVAYEYIASQTSKEMKGVLVLSEFAGSAQSLNGSILVNPWNIDELAEALNEALTVPVDRRAKNYDNLFEYVQKYTRYDNC